MKFNMNEPLSRSAKRVLSAFFGALSVLLGEKPFEEISVSEICEKAGYPRATFYNYFLDKYDLLNMIWVFVERTINVGEESYSDAKSPDVYFDRLYDILASGEEEIRRVLVHNRRDGYLVASLGIYLRKSVRNMLLSMSADSLSPLPIDMLTDHLTNTLMLVFGYRFDGRGEKIGKEKTKEYLFRLISGNLNITIPRWE